MKHWTTEAAEEWNEQGYKYTVIPTKPNSVGGEFPIKSKGVDSFREAEDFIIEQANPAKERIRLGFSSHNNNRLLMVYYPEDGSFWVVGYLILHSEMVLDKDRWDFA
jgi:hypothetical protein